LIKREEILKVVSLLNLLCKINIKLTFENQDNFDQACDSSVTKLPKLLDLISKGVLQIGLVSNRDKAI